MGRKDRWESNGPGSLDVNSYLEALQAYHGAVCHFEIRPHPVTKSTGVLQVKLVAQPGPGPELASGPLQTLHVEGVWPSSSCRDLTALMYRLCVDVDNKLGREWWAQRALPF